MEGTSTLADSLLDDLDDLSDVEDVADDAKNILQGETETSQTHKEFTGPRRKRFLDDPNLLKHVNEVRYNEKNNMEKPQSKDQDAEEYRLIVQSNKQLANLANELSLTHIDLCTAYHPKFPEL
jgi:RNA processing factor Prp31